MSDTLFSNTRHEESQHNDDELFQESSVQQSDYLKDAYASVIDV